MLTYFFKNKKIKQSKFNMLTYFKNKDKIFLYWSHMSATVSSSAIFCLLSATRSL